MRSGPATLLRCCPAIALVAVAGLLPATAPASATTHKCQGAKGRGHAKHRTGQRRCARRPAIRAHFDHPLRSLPPQLAEATDVTQPSPAGVGADAALPPTEGTRESQVPPAALESQDEPPGSELPTGFRFFSPTSIWNEPVAAASPLDPDSASIVTALESLVGSELAAKTGPSINTTESSVPLYTVPADQPTVPVELQSGFAAPALRSAWSAVPVPPDTQPARGNDRHLVVWQPSTDRLWEFWEMNRDGDAWEAGWGGAMLHASESSGVYDSASWPGATRFWGASASSLSIAGGLITLEDLERGRIDHALSMSVPNVRAGVYSSPAQRGDGKSADPLALPEGAHLRIDPDLDLGRLHLPGVTLMLAEAAQRYGIFVRDGARSVTFQAQDPTPTGSDPYRGPDGFWEGSYPRAILAAFPWSHLQLLQMDLHANP